ncbi:hypothetical protein CI15_33540 [Paraburkholderia monticola]|uniref:Uncharacterized protein n=1 Tax=Paraburkholderia monticola TaxID=1399968 RepID=A0A149PBR4_9BURK|nr:hypothetical protein [Paraburkholderia monticola]KXU82456.1 hypothetical protein CI15_33540 [Paraburkholderia monticola]
MIIRDDLRRLMAQNLLDFIEEHPDEPIFAAYPNPAKEFSVSTRGEDIAITHPTLGTVLLTTR